jgi:hypothetical protein
VNEDALAHRSRFDAVVHDPVRGSYSAAVVHGGWDSALGSKRPVTSTVPSDNGVAL